MKRLIALAVALLLALLPVFCLAGSYQDVRDSVVRIYAQGV